jgi:phenylacetate-CoA ligase
VQTNSVIKESILRAYHRSPPAIRSAVASLNGWRLRSWRYGPETERLRDEALSRECWSVDKLQDWQNDQLAPLLHRAATQVPFYREQWNARRRQGDQKSWEYLENWPVLEKEFLRQNPKAFLADGCDVRRMFRVHTSGTTGTPLDVWYSKTTARAWYALFEARCRNWHGVSRHDRWAILGGRLVVPTYTRRPPFWVWNHPLNQLYMSSYHLAGDLISHYLEALSRYRIQYLLGYTSSLYQLAIEALASGRTIKMKVVVTNAEPLYKYQREKIEQAFQCPVRETYGIAEIAVAASECANGRLHSWSDVSRMEVLREQADGPLEDAGDLVATGLVNVDMPLIRYRVGDRVALSPNGHCPCGRTLPTLTSVEGRCDDLLLTRDGRRIGRLDPVFKTNIPIREAQIIQEAIDLLRVRYVPTKDFTAEDGQVIVDRLRARMGDVQVILEKAEKLPRGPNGKLRAVVCKLPTPTR